LTIGSPVFETAFGHRFVEEKQADQRLDDQKTPSQFCQEGTPRLEPKDHDTEQWKNQADQDQKDGYEKQRGVHGWIFLNYPTMWKDGKHP
jgi:hypothetical protein